MEKIIIGLVGRKQAGKDSVADHLVEDCGYTRIAFADALREMAYGANPIVSIDPVLTYQEAVDADGYDVAKEKYPLLRKFLQNLGTEGVRKIEPDFWVDQLKKRAEAIEGNVVVTDVRFLNEMSTIEKMGGVSVRVYRPGFSDAPAEHRSETELDNVATDFVIWNDSAIDALEEKVEHLREWLFDRAHWPR